MSDIEQRLREAGDEMRAENQNGWPVVCDMAADEIASLRSKLEEAEGALEPFALVAEYDIGDSESDEDIFRPMDGRNSVSGLVRVGHLRAARRTLASLREADHA